MLAFLPAITGVAQAGYVPPQGEPTSGSPVSAGSRSGCEPSDGVALNLLAPTQHTGQTTTTTPTLAWFVPATAPYRLRLSVYRNVLGQPSELVYHQEHVEQQAGVRYLSIDPAAPLTVGDRYTWQVLIGCDPDDPRYQQAASTTLDVVSPSDEITVMLAEATAPAQRAEIYASQGYWYDAVREALADPETQPGASNTLAELLQDVARLEQDPGNTQRVHADALRMIAEAIADGRVATTPNK